MVRAVEALKDAQKTTFLCLSNANSVYIQTILQSRGLDALFDEVVTNPAHWEESGLLSLRRRVDPDGPQHGCKVGCSPNMCKGACIAPWCAAGAEQRQARSSLRSSPATRPSLTESSTSATARTTFAPSCASGGLLSPLPSLLSRTDGFPRSQDVVLCRRYRGLEKKLTEHAADVKCGVKYWAGAWEVEELLGAIDK
jgi:pyridoxal phosphate phosphatase PHOSPHO2